ncbi:golgin subfamily A member 6-like protein 22 [Labrus mixtus]|uniref:golgin subfamily A member 6-like protein 22 n=1 Tax=Labrus mixtus TaxID=508554 RepID=UPI0029BFBB8C|nr:golgin subfamily A member 6-like protein 22 [Labrus mixtus]
MLFGGFYYIYRNNQSEIVSCLVSEKTKRRVEKEALLKKESEKKQAELDVWTPVLSSLKEVKSGLEKQKLEIKSQLETIKKEREKNKEKVKEMEKKISDSRRENATDRAEGYVREKESLLDALGKLEKRNEELDEQELNTEGLLLKLERVINKMIETLKIKENEMMLIDLQLGQGESEDDIVHLHRE